MRTLYHITTPKNAMRIIKNGFYSGRIYFTKPKYVNYWKKKLEKERKCKLVLLKILVSDTFYNTNFFDWDKDENVSGAYGQVSYGEGKYGWYEPITCPRLIHNINCKMEIKWRN